MATAAELVETRVAAERSERLEADTERVRSTAKRLAAFDEAMAALRAREEARADATAEAFDALRARLAATESAHLRGH